MYTAGGNGAPPPPHLTTIGGSVDGGGGPGGRNPRVGRGSSVANVRITDPSRRTTYALPARPILLPGLADILYHRLLDALKDHLPVSTSLKVQVIQGRGDWSKTGRFSFSPYISLTNSLISLKIFFNVFFIVMYPPIFFL